MLRSALKTALLAVLVYFIVSFVEKQGFHLHYKKHHPGECKRISGLDFGSEDLEVTTSGQAFITSGLSSTSLTAEFKEFVVTNNIVGRIFLYDFNKPNLGAVELKLIPSKDFRPDSFHPHGISVLEDKVKGEHLIYVVNHPVPDADRVEKFQYQPKTNELVHVRSFACKELFNTNDLAVLAEDKFYISNFMYFTHPLMSLLENLIQIPLGSLLFYNGTDFSQIGPCLFGPNGLMLSNDKRYLYLNLPLKEAMNVYERKSDTSLEVVQTVQLHSAVDNSFFSGDVLYTGAHPIPYKVFQHLNNPKNQAPSSVLRLPLKNGRVIEEDITELFYDHGDLISASSVAAVYKNQLIIGSIMDKLVLCDASTKL